MYSRLEQTKPDQRTREDIRERRAYTDLLHSEHEQHARSNDEQPTQIEPG